MVMEFAPGRAGALEQDNAEAESATLPNFLENQLAVRTRQRSIRAERYVDLRKGGGAHADFRSAAGRATPIITSRVTIAANAFSSHPSVPAGRSGSTR